MIAPNTHFDFNIKQQPIPPIVKKPISFFNDNNAPAPTHNQHNNQHNKHNNQHNNQPNNQHPNNH